MTKPDKDQLFTKRSHTAKKIASFGKAIVVLLFACLSPVVVRGQNVISGENWFPIGPADISNGQTYGSLRVNASGRATAIAVNPLNPNDVWLGTAAGGVWHSLDGGVNWIPMSDNEASLAIGAITLDNCTAQGCNTIYAGTGENAIRRDTYYGMGLLIGDQSGGEIPQFTWRLKGAELFRFTSINSVVLDRTSPEANKVIYISVSSGQTASATESTVTAPPPPNGYGIYKSSDRGANWARLTIPGADGFKPTDIEIDPTNPRILYAGFLGRGIFKTSDGGTTWCPLNPGIPRPAGCPAATGLPNPTTTTFDWVQISIHRPSAASPAILYATLGTCLNPLIDSCVPFIFKSTDGGTSWTQQLAGGSGGGTDSSCPRVYSRYTHGLAIHPSNPNTILLAAVRLCRSTNSGQAFTEMGNNIHPDHHSLVFPDPANPNRLYDTNDGGFSFSNDGGVTWTSGNSDLQITGFHSVATSPLTARVIGGSQDNGTQMWLGTRIWEHRHDGDTGFNILDLDNVMSLFDTNFYISPFQSTNGGNLNFFSSIGNGIATGPAAFYAPFVQAAAAPHSLYFGTNVLYRRPNTGGTWTAISPVLGGTGTVFPDINTTNVITSIAVAPSNGNRIFVGHYDGQIFVTDSACTTTACWTSIGGSAKGLPNTVVTRIAVDPGNADTVYATFSGFHNGAHVFKTTNRGASWSPINNGLPSIPTNTITIESSSRLWVGTDDGVYKSVNSGGSWTRFGSGLPRVPVYEISIDITRGRLFAATHGRGVFVLTRPFLSNYEGWVNNDIWDIPVYGNGFVGTVTNPVGTPCTMQIIQRDGAVCSASTTDVMGGVISFDNSGQLVTSKGGFYIDRPVAWACFNGKCIGNKNISQCNPSNNPLTSVVVSCGTEVGIDHVLGCPAQANPPTSILGLQGMPGGGPRAAAPVGNEGQMPGPVSFDVIPSVQGRTGTRALCTSNISLPAGTGPLQALLTARDAINSNAGCQQNGVSAVVKGIPPEPNEGLEDLLASPPVFGLSAPNVVGGQLFTAVRAAPGAATGVCFNVSDIGSPLQNQIAVMKVEFETLSGGAAGGELTVTERSSLGACSVTVRTNPGDTAAQIATTVANAFQAPGIPGSAACPAIQNPRDITVEGSSIVSVLASELRVCNADQGLGIFIGPKELPNTRRLLLQYAAKVVCGVQPPKRAYGVKGPQQLATGSYYTVVNIHNPTDKSVAFRFKFATALPGGKPGPISRFFDVKLKPDEVISIDCSQLFGVLQGKPSFVDGFAVIESEVELDVVAVYTAAGVGKAESLTIERIPGRLQ